MPTKTTTIAAKKENRLKRVKNVLLSQPKPERSPYFDLETKYKIHLDWRPLITIEGYTEKEFRRQRIRHDEYPCIVFTSKNAIENYFRLAEEMRFKINEMNKYFCATEAIANYLQKFIIFRKRKVFNGVKSVTELANYFTKHKEAGPFLIPCSESGNPEVASFLKSLKVKFLESPMYRRVSSELKDLKDSNYDLVVLFSPQEVKSIFDNFPEFEQGSIRIAAFGSAVAKAVTDAGLFLDIQAPTLETPSMTMAIEEYLKQANK
ncbi:MAG: uroporphyrinogen-III synthase [Saprospiraceae bacterium]|nr:uroporphyrinogen-III synthase [Saprospiraceae bacterium]